MVRIRRTAHKSTGGRLTIERLAPCGTPRQQEETVEPQQEEPVEPQQKEPIEPQSGESPKPQEEEPTEIEDDAIHSHAESNDLSDYTPLSDLDDLDSELKPVRVATKFRS
jgi:hypothetical protein